MRSLMNSRHPTLQDAFALHRQGRVGDAARVYESIVAREPANAEARHYLGVILASSGRLEEARALMKRSLELKPRDFSFLENYVTLLVGAEAFDEALDFARKAAAIQPRSPNALYLLAVCLQKTGFLAEARAKFSALLQADPNHFSGRKEYAVTLAHLGELDEAARVIEALIAEQSRFADAYLVRANIRAMRGAFADALADFERALALQPNSHEAWRSYASALQELGLHEQAVGAYDRAIALRPNHEAHIGRGRALTRLSRIAEALAAYDKAVALGGDSRGQASVARASALAIAGESDEARRALRRVVETHPTFATAWLALSNLVKFKPGDPAVAAMEALLADGAKQADGEAIALRFALGKAYLDCGDSKRAFEHLDAGNRLRRAQLAYDADAHVARTAAIAAAFPAEIFDRFAGAGSRAAAPIFVVGMPRAGTTLIEQILASHAAIHGAGELNHLPVLAAEMGGVPEGVAALTPQRLAELGDAYVAGVGALPDGKSRFVDKLPGNAFNAGLIRLILPQAKIVHARRDPVDTCLSCYVTPFEAAGLAFTFDMTELGRHFRDYQALMAHWRAVLPAANFIEVDYEDVVADVETQARRMIAFLELPWDPACLEFHRARRPVFTASVNQVREPIYRTSAGRWRKHAAELGPLLAALEIAAPQ